MPNPSSPAGADLFRGLFAAYPDALVVSNAEGKIVLANAAAARLLGYGDDELIGLSIDVLVPDSIRPRHAAYRDGYGHHPRTRPMGTQMELVARRRDGSEVMVEIALSPLRVEERMLVVAAIRDIAAYPRMKQALLRARYSDALAQLGRRAVDARNPQQMLQHGADAALAALQVDVTRVLRANLACTEFRVIAGAGELAGVELDTVLPLQAGSMLDEMLRTHAAVVSADLTTEHRYAVSEHARRAGLVSAVAIPLIERGQIMGAFTAGSRVAHGFGDDEMRFLESLTNLLVTCLQRAESETALQHTQRLESVGQLTGGIAHDFNNLLTVIQGNLQVLEEREGVMRDPQAVELVASASRAASRSAELTAKLLTFSRRQLLQPRAVDVGAMVHSLADMLQRTIDRRIVIRVDAPAHGPYVEVDAAQLESALLNIAINARDAMPGGGEFAMQVTVPTALPDAARAVMQDPQDAAYVELTLSDNGSGMSEAVKQRAFEPFFTTKPSGRGTGLGLSTVYGFMQQSGGAVLLTSEPGMGTRLRLYFPRLEDCVHVCDGDAYVAMPIPAGLKVLLVEDDPDVRAVACGYLLGLNAQVTQASDAAAALEALQSGQRFDLLVSDISLGPGERGTAVAAHAQRVQPHIRILLVSGFSAELVDADREAPDHWELLAKPYRREEFTASIARVIARH